MCTSFSFLPQEKIEELDAEKKAVEEELRRVNDEYEKLNPHHTSTKTEKSKIKERQRMITVSLLLFNNNIMATFSDPKVWK